MIISPKILIVDDEPYNIDYLEQELEELNYETVSAANGQEALDKIQLESPDLILLDIMMPVMDGFEVLSHIMADPTTRDIPVIVISASNDLKSVVKGIQLGAEDYLPKPFEPALLRARIASSLEKKHLRDMQQLYLKGLERELEIGREIQQGFLPAVLPRAADWEIAASFKAAREVAGDFYDTFLLPDGDLVCVIGDVCGKGVGAALFMTLFRSLVRATFTTGYFRNPQEERILTPAERLRYVTSFINTYITETHGETNMFATLFIGIFSLDGGMLNYVNCGNEPPILVRNGRVSGTLSPTGPVVGVIPKAKFVVKALPMERDDFLLAFTDGVLDACNPEKESFGCDRLTAIFKTDISSPTMLIQRIEEQLHQFIGGADQFDDITMLVVKRQNDEAHSEPQ